MPTGYTKKTGENPFKGKKRKPFTEEHKRKISLGHKGLIPWNKGKKSPQSSGINHPKWKGNDVGYYALHMWLSRTLGKASKCSNGHRSNKYVWANISGEYKRELFDWHELCVSCNSLDGVKKHQRFLNI